MISTSFPIISIAFSLCKRILRVLAGQLGKLHLVGGFCFALPSAFPVQIALIVPAGADVEFQVDNAGDAVGTVCEDLQNGVKWGILVLDAGDCKGVVCPVSDIGRAGNIVAVSLLAVLGAALAAVGYQMDMDACLMGEVHQLAHKGGLCAVLYDISMFLLLP